MKFSLYLVTGVALLAALFYLFKPQSGDKLPAPGVAATQPPVPPSVPGNARPPASPSGPTTPAAKPEPAATVVDLAIANGKLVSGPTVIQVKQNDRVIVHVKSDSADEIHLHGYERVAPTNPGDRAVLEFTADRSGVYTAELERSGVSLLEVTVP